MVVVRVPGWGLDCMGAHYYGWRHSIHVGPFLIFWGRMSLEEIEAWDGSR